MDDAARALVERAVGPIRGTADRSWPHGVTRVWRVEAGGEVVWVKRHSQERKFRQEDCAYDVVVPALGAAGWRVPRRIASDGVRTLVLSHVPGEPARQDDPAVHRQAGEALAALHAVPCDDANPEPLRDALRARLERWIREGRGVVDDALVADVVAGFADGAAFDGAVRRWCHRDWSARNWLVEEGALGVIDYEHTAPDLWLFDLVRLCETSFAHPGVREAFLDGYGPLPPGTSERLRQLMWVTELGTVVWSVAHGDAEYEAIGRRTLARLRAGEDPLGPWLRPNGT